MRYQVFGFSQEQAVKMGLSISQLAALSVIEGMICNSTKKTVGNHTTIIHYNGSNYFWVTYALIAREYPTIWSGRDPVQQVERDLKVLLDKGFLKKLVFKINGTYTHFTLNIDLFLSLKNNNPTKVAQSKKDSDRLTHLLTSVNVAEVVVNDKMTVAKRSWGYLIQGQGKIISDHTPRWVKNNLPPVGEKQPTKYPIYYNNNPINRNKQITQEFSKENSLSRSSRGIEPPLESIAQLPPRSRKQADNTNRQGSRAHSQPTPTSSHQLRYQDSKHFCVPESHPIVDVLVDVDKDLIIECAECFHPSTNLLMRYNGDRYLVLATLLSEWIDDYGVNRVQRAFQALQSRYISRELKVWTPNYFRRCIAYIKGTKHTGSSTISNQL